jgi:hypothetical protein
MKSLQVVLYPNGRAGSANKLRVRKASKFLVDPLLVNDALYIYASKCCDIETMEHKILFVQ